MTQARNRNAAASPPRVTFAPNGAPQFVGGLPIYALSTEEAAAIEALDADPEGCGALPVEHLGRTMTAAAALTDIRQREYLARELEAIARNRK